MLFIRKLTLCLAVSPVLLAAGATDSALLSPLRPQAVENIGTFCRTGTVIVVNDNVNFAIRDSNGGYRFMFARNPFGLAPGDRIAVSGELIRHDNGETHESVRQVVHLGKDPLPPPKPSTIADLVKHDAFSSTVSVEGTLVLIRRDEIDASFLQFFVKDGASVLCASLTVGTNRTQPQSAAIPLGARVRLTGVMMPISGGARKNIDKHLLLDPNAGIDVIAAPPDDIFAAPELNLESPWTPDEIVRMDLRRFSGVVLATWNGRQMMVEGPGFQRIKITLALPEEIPSAGEHVTVVGFPDADMYGTGLIYARCKRQPEQQIFSGQKPTSTTLRHLFTDERGRPRINGYSHGRLLRIRGTILDIQPSLSLFSLNSDGITIPVDCSGSPGAIPALETDSKVEITVLAVMETDGWRESIAFP